MIKDGRFRLRDHVVEGLDNTGHAMIDMLTGRNVGKTVVRVTTDPAI